MSAIAGTVIDTMTDYNDAGYNAKLAAMQAEQSTALAVENENRVRRESDYAMGKLRARAGASGRAASGSVLDVLHESAINFELDALNARYEGETQAYGYREQAKLQKSKRGVILARGAFQLVEDVARVSSKALAGGA